VINVEVRSLGTLKEQVLAVLIRFVEEFGNVTHKGCYSFSIGKVFLCDGCRIERFCSEEAMQDEVLFLQIGVEFFEEASAVQEVVHSDAVAANLVFVAGANPSSGGADFGFALPFFPDGVQDSMVGHDDVCVSADNQVLRSHTQPIFEQEIHFPNQYTGVNHDSVADKTGFPRVENSGGNEVKDKLLVIDNKSVACIVTTLETDHAVSLVGEQVNNFPFSFVSPLGSYDYDIRHGILFPVFLAHEKQGSECSKNPDTLLETLSELAHTVTPANAGVQKTYRNLDSGVRRNDVQQPLCHFEILS